MSDELAVANMVAEWRPPRPSTWAPRMLFAFCLAGVGYLLGKVELCARRCCCSRSSQEQTAW
eukprot:9712617-Alexandrium_andersonii.AAC.1